MSRSDAEPDPGANRVADVAELFSRNTLVGPQPAVKASTLERFVKSPITVWCELHVDPKHHDPPNAYQDLLFKRGHQHQTVATATLFGESVTESFKTEEDGFKRVLQLMSLGVRSVADMPMLCRPLGLEGRPDVVVRVDGQASAFGGHAYEIVEIKSARRIRRHHILQAALYSRALGRVQGAEPTEFHLVNGDVETTTYEARLFDDELDEALAALRAVLTGEPVAPIYGDALWPWEGYVNRLAHEAGDASVITGVGASIRAGLAEIGLTTVDAVASAEEESLVAVKRIGPSKAARIGSSARAIREGRVVARSPIADIQTGTTEVFLDLEGSTPELSDDGIATVNYLIGSVVRRAHHERASGHQSGPLQPTRADPAEGPDATDPVRPEPVEGPEAEFVSFFTDKPQGEAANTRAFFQWASELDDPVFYHWHHYERTHLRKMAARFAVQDEQATFVMNRMVDLSPITTNAFAFPTYGEGLKPIARHLGFDWRQGDVDALASVALYTQFAESEGSEVELREKILTYNEDDCRATMLIYDWLVDRTRSDGGPEA